MTISFKLGSHKHKNEHKIKGNGNDVYTYKVIKKFLRRSNEMNLIAKLMSLVVTTSSKMKIAHSTRSEWIA